MVAAVMSTLRKRLDSVEKRAEFQQYLQSLRQFQGRSHDEELFFIVHGFSPESVGDELPPRTEFTVRGIKTIVTTEWDDDDIQRT